MKKLDGINLKQLKEIIANRIVFCYGCGIQGKRMAMFFDNWQSKQNLKGYIDNDESKSGSTINIGEDIYPVYSLKSVIQLLDAKTLILITCLDYQSIYAQLEFFDDIDCEIVAIDIVAQKELMESDYDEVIKESSNQLIPQKIHYAWLGKEMPYDLKKNVEHWKELCPDYEFYEWNENNYDVTINKYMRQAYERKMWGFVPDYMRLDVIYKYGGIYLDTDIEMIKKPDELLYQECFGCVDASLVMNLGSGFGAVPGTEIIRELRDYYNDISFIKEDGSIDKTSCNTHSYNVLKKYGVKVNNKLQNVYGMNIYPMIFQGACQYTKTKRLTDKTYWIHYGNMSWFKNNKEKILY